MAANLQGAAPSPGRTEALPPGRAPEFPITALMARQKATRFVITEISTQLLGDTPALHAGDRPCWSVPILLTSPARGIVGKVGDVGVDAITGELLVEQDTVRRLTEDARRLAERSPL